MIIHSQKTVPRHGVEQVNFFSPTSFTRLTSDLSDAAPTPNEALDDLGVQAHRFLVLKLPELVRHWGAPDDVAALPFLGILKWPQSTKLLLPDQKKDFRAVLATRTKLPTLVPCSQQIHMVCYLKATMYIQYDKVQ